MLLSVGVVCGSLATFGQASATVPPQPDGLDHFKCYEGTANKRDPFERHTNVVLADQFGKVDVHVARFPDRLCNPVEKTLPTGETFPPKNPRAHLTCWPIKGPEFTPVEVKVANQFGDANMVVTKRQRLCLPSWKALRGEQLPPEEQPPGLDHFQCYQAEYSKAVRNRFEVKPPAVLLKDQFESVDVKVGQPRVLCNPVEKTRLDNGEVTPITNPEAHLVCFVIRESPTFDGPTARVKNQFGVGRLDVGKENTLCLPSFKGIAESS